MKNLILPGLPQCSEGKPILVAEAWNISPHLETGVEIAVRLAMSGYSVDYLHYGEHLPVVEGWSSKGSGIIELFKGRLKSPQRRAENLIRSIALKHNLSLRVLQPPRMRYEKFSLSNKDLQDISTLKKACWQGSSDFGLAIASSLIDYTQDSTTDPARHKNLCDRLAATYYGSYHIIKSLVKRNLYSGVVIFNGRFACVKGAKQAADSGEVPVFFHERGSSSSRFSLTSYQPHDRVSRQFDIVEAWARCSDYESSSMIGSSYFHLNREGVSQHWLSFTSDQRQGLACHVVNNARSKSRSGKCIVYFSSSDDEMASVGDFYSMEEFEWSDQRSALALLASACHVLGHSLVVRVHPHLAKKVGNGASTEQNTWDNLTFLTQPHSIELIKSTSKASSYDLIDSADAVVTFGSTVGIEAVFWGKPSIVLGPCLYDRINATVYQPKTSGEIHGLIADPENLHVSSKTAIPYGYYMKTFGEDFCLYKPVSLFHGTFDGMDLSHYEASIPRKLISLIQYRISTERSAFVRQ